jgi:hypothetical protein
MDRQIVYTGAIPQDTDVLNTNKNVMVGLGFALQAILGTGTLFDGLACTPNTPAALNVLVGPGSAYSLQNVDGTAYGSLAPDTADQIVKQGIVQSTTTLSTPAPTTAGQSINYLVQAAYQDVDAGSTVLPYYSVSNPAVAYSGPANSGVSQNTVRKGVCVILVKAGTSATTGTQTTPAPDAGYTGLYSVTVANGQTTVTSGNIQQLATAPFIGVKLPGILAAIQQDTANYAQDTSGSANTITVTLSPIPSSLTNGMPVRVKVANTTTGATVININGLGNVSVVTANGSALASGALQANGIYTFVYDANGTRWQVQGITTAAATNGYFYGGTTGGTANAQTLASVTPSGFTKSQGNAVAFTAGATNTGATTFNINATGATAVKIDTGSGLAALTGGEIVNGNDYVVYYDGTQYVLIDPSTLAFLNSPALTGTPTAPTAAFGTNTTQLATTAFVHAALSTPNYYANTPSAPTGTSSASPVMMGLAGAITPNFSGAVEFTVTGVALQSGSPGTIGIQIYYGTGTAPTNGASQTGTAIGTQLQPNLVSQATEGSGFSLNYIVSGLTSGTPYWFDLGLSNSAGNTSNVKNLTVVAKELK